MLSRGRITSGQVKVSFVASIAIWPMCTWPCAELVLESLDASLALSNSIAVSCRTGKDRLIMVPGSRNGMYIPESGPPHVHAAMDLRDIAGAFHFQKVCLEGGQDY